MDLIGEVFLKTNRYFADLDIVHSGYSPEVIHLLTFYIAVVLISLLKINGYLKLSLSVLVFFLLLSFSSVKPEYKVFVFKGIKKPNVIVITPYGECFYTKKIKSVLDKNRCKERVKFGEQFPYTVVSDVKLFEKNKKVVLKIENRFFTLKNKNYFFQPVPVK